MFRALIELGFTILLVILARAILSSLIRGFTNAGSHASAPSQPAQKDSAKPDVIHPTGELHKDPVCGTYVSESTPYRRQQSGSTFYYCSADCKEKHALVTR